MAGRLVLATERLLLREFDEGDVLPYYLLGTNRAVTRYTGARLTSLRHALEVLRASPLADYQKCGYGRWACALKDRGEIIGFAGLKYLSELGEVDLGYRLLPAYWGAGLATEAARAVLEYGLARIGLERVVGLVDPENVASVRVLEKIGMAYSGKAAYLGDTVARYVAHSEAAASIPWPAADACGNSCSPPLPTGNEMYGEARGR